MRCLPLALVIGFLGLRTFAQSPAQTPALAPDPTDIARRVEKALGWTGKFESTLALKIEGTLDGAPITVYAKQPTLFRMELTQGKDRIVQAYDGSFGWQQMLGDHPQSAAELTGRALDQLIDQASNAIGGPLVRAPERGTHLEYEGQQNVDGKTCYKLKLTLVSESVIYCYIDAATYLEVREELVNKDNKSIIEESVDDYKTFGGIQFPCRFVSHSKGETKLYEFRIDRITINPAPVPGLFAMPAH